MNKFILKLKETALKMSSLNRTDKELAASVALGVGIGFSPYLGFHTYLAVFLSAYFKLPIYPVILGTLVSNPVTLPFIYTFSTQLGMKLLGTQSYGEIHWKYFHMKDIVTTARHLLFPFLLGTNITALISGLLTYIVSFNIFKFVRKQSDKSLKR